MGMKRTAELVAGSMVVYFVMAACTAAGGSGWDLGDDGGQDEAAGDSDSAGTPSGSGSSGGRSSSGGASASGAGILDALTDPVPSAMADNTQSGTRLKVNYYSGSDGSKQATSSMHDSQLNVDCYFGTAADGTTRCLPSGIVAIGQFFSDSGCSQPIGYVTSTCSGTPAYASQSAASGTCGAYVQHLYSIGGAFSGTPFYGSPTSCTALTTDADASALSRGYAMAFASYAFFSVGSEVSPSTFVQATIQTAP